MPFILKLFFFIYVSFSAIFCCEQKDCFCLISSKKNQRPSLCDKKIFSEREEYKKILKIIKARVPSSRLEERHFFRKVLFNETILYFPSKSVDDNSYMSFDRKSEEEKIYSIFFKKDEDGMDCFLVFPVIFAQKLKL